MHPQKLHFQNCLLKKCILKTAPLHWPHTKYKITPLQNTFSKLFPQKTKKTKKNHFLKYISKLLPQKVHFQNCSLKKYENKLSKYIFKKHIFKIAPSKNPFSKHYFKISPSKKTLLKLLPKKINHQNCSPQKYIFSKLLFQNYSLKDTFSKFLSPKILIS